MCAVFVYGHTTFCSGLPETMTSMKVDRLVWGQASKVIVHQETYGVQRPASCGTNQCSLTQNSAVRSLQTICISLCQKYIQSPLKVTIKTMCSILCVHRIFIIGHHQWKSVRPAVLLTSMHQWTTGSANGLLPVRCQAITSPIQLNLLDLFWDDPKLWTNACICF